MPRQKEKSPKTIELRQQAEASVRQHKVPAPLEQEVLSPEDSRRLVHELRVHQIELELQNEELRRSQVELEAARVRYYDLYNLAPVGYCTLSELGLIQEANLTAAELLGLPRAALLQQFLSRFIFREDQDSFYLHCRHLLDTGAPQTWELRLVKQSVQELTISAAPFWVRLTATVLPDGQGSSEIRIGLTDIQTSKFLELRTTMERNLMEFLAQAHPLADQLEQLVLCHEGLLPGMRGAVLGLEPATQRLRLLAAPSLPSAFRQGLHGAEPGPALGSCAATLVTGKAHMVAELERDPRCFDGHHLALAYGLKACWSVPILAQGDRVLGLLAFFSETPRRALVAELDTLERGAQLASLALLRHQGEEELRESEARFRLLADQAPVLIWTAGLDQGCDYFNQVWLDFTGRTLAQELGNGWAEGVHPDDLPGCLETYTSHFDRRQTFRMEYRLRHAQGDYRWILDQGMPRHNADGLFLGYIGSCIDITESRQAIEALRTAALYSRSLLESSLDPLVTISPEGQITDVNQATERITGVARATLIGSDFADYFTDPAAARAGYQEVFTEGQVVDYPLALRHCSGTITQVLYNASLYRDEQGQILGVFAAARDITKRQQAEQSLLQAHQRMENIIDATRVGTWEWNVQTGATSFNETWAGMLGWTLAELAPINIQTWETLCHPDDFKEAHQRLQQHFTGQQPYYDVEFRMRHRDGHWVWIHDRGRVITRTQDGQPLLMFGTHSDISQRKLAEEAKREALDRLQKIAARVPGVVYQFRLRPDGSSCFPFASEAIRDIYGVSPEDVREDAAKVFAVLHPEDLPAVAASIQASARDLTPWQQEYRVRREDGITQTVLGNALPQLEADGSVLWHGFITDITERKALEAQFHQLQKLDSLGTLASGVAHDMNNVLGAILGLASMHVEVQPAGSPAQRAFETITRACDRGGGLIQRLLGFARQGLAEERELDLNALIQEEVRLLERTTFAKVHLDMDLAAELHPMRGDANALSHVLMNLCVNAVDAMPENGTLTLRTRNSNPGWIEVHVEDTGIGMTREVLQKAMDPFFTTKAQGKGTGLGLSTAHSIVLAHRGRLELQSEPGRGTKVLMRFPACAPVPLLQEAEAIADRGASASTLKVLLVDDDELIQTALQSILEALGHSVVLAPSGEQALAELAGGYQPDVVILDLNMPGLGGAGTLPRLRALRPTLPVLLATGRADQAALDLIAAHPLVTLLPKPFGVKELHQHLDPLGRD